MKLGTEQEDFWASEFGTEYRKRNTFTPEKLDIHYLQTWGYKRSDMNLEFISGLEDAKILEVGCNIGNQLRMLEWQNHSDLWGIEINEDAVSIAKSLCRKTQITCASAFDLPFEDNTFDLVFTSGLLIHIQPEDLEKVISEIYRVTNKYIWGFEYFSKMPLQINYRGHKERLWKNDFPKVYQGLFRNLVLIRKKLYPYTLNNNQDIMFLLEKRNQ